MEFEQTTIFDPVRQYEFEKSYQAASQATYLSMQRDYEYAKLDFDGKICALIDYVTVIFEKCTMRHVLDWLHLGFCVSDFLNAESREFNRGYERLRYFTFQGIRLEIRQADILGIDNPESWFDQISGQIRLDISGEPLNFLRSIGVDFADHRYVVPVLPTGGSYHFTRLDVAYDFINYKPEFMDRMIMHCQTHALASGRVPVAFNNTALSCKIVTGKEKIVYLGSVQSDRLLRCYDKRLQFIDRKTGLYMKHKDNPYGNPDSWFRIEWQLRNREAERYARGETVDGKPPTFASILYDIYERYAFADGLMDARAQARRPVEFWMDLFDWKEVESRIVQNAKYVQPKSFSDRCKDRIQRGTRFDILSLFFETNKQRIERMNRYLFVLFSENDPLRDGERTTFLNQINQLLVENPEFKIFDSRPDALAAGGGLYRNCGILQVC